MLYLTNIIDVGWKRLADTVGVTVHPECLMDLRCGLCPHGPGPAPSGSFPNSCHRVERTPSPVDVSSNTFTIN